MSLNRASRSSSLTECALFFFAAAGSALGWTAVLSNLVYYTDTLGVDSFLYLQLVIYVPLLPITIFQAIWDSYFDQQYPVYSYWFRGSAGYGVTLAALALLPEASQSLVQLNLVSLCLGLASAVLHGTLKQIATFCSGDGRLQAAVTSGMQAAALLSGIVTLVVGPAAKKEDLETFYHTIAVLVLLCWMCFQGAVMFQPNVRQALEHHSSSISMVNMTPNDPPDNSEPLLSPPTTEYGLSIEGDETDPDATSVVVADPSQQVNIWSQTWPIGTALFLTVASSMAVASWFNRVPYHSGNANLPQVLFYTRLLADLLGRPATLLKQFRQRLLLCSIVRIVVGLPLFFGYCLVRNVPRNDTLVTLGVFFFSLSSGYLATSCYQVAPTLLGNHTSNSSAVQQQTNQLNLCFSGAVCVGLLISFLLKFTI